MSDFMKPMSFEKMIHSLIGEYKASQTFYGVPVKQDIKDEIPIGPAAGPHTQLAANIICAYAAGASYFELKTVQLLEGEELGLVKPCIYVGHEVYNTEWSTELTVKQAGEEYIKAYLLIGILSKVFGLRSLDKLHFIMSVGYDLQGIKSPKVDKFLETMKQGHLSHEWQKDCEYIKAYGKTLWGLTDGEISELISKDQISDTVTLSTLHGAKGEEIQEIATYLMKEKGLNTYVKLNPTLLGKEKIQQLLKQKGYGDICFLEALFQHDPSLAQVEEMLTNLKEVAKGCQREFGIKLTNTFPVQIKHEELPGSEMYMSGPPLYPIAMGVTYALAQHFNGEIKISYSGGIDTSNIKALLETGVAPITVSSFLLKPGGYKNLSKLIEASKGYQKANGLQVDLLEQLAKASSKDQAYDYKVKPVFKTQTPYDVLCSKCHNCVDVCPNRANVAIIMNEIRYVLHIDDLCNACGCCKCECIMGHSPYNEKFTVFTERESFENSRADGVLYEEKEDTILAYRHLGKLMAVPSFIRQLISTLRKEGRI